MRDKLYIKSRLDNVCAERIPQVENIKIKHQERIKILAWIYNFGDIRPENDLRIQLRNTEEEIMAFSYTNTTGLPLEIANIKKYELENILEII